MNLQRTILPAFFLTSSFLFSQPWHSFSLPTKSSFRGLCVVTDSVVWASGTKGTFLLTMNGGRTWKTDSIAGATDLDFRDIEAFDSKTALVISSGAVGKIFKTNDAGKSWKETYSGTVSGLFFDGFAFKDRKNGIAFSDPVKGKFFVILTKDGGETWQETEPSKIPTALEKEAAFAASGTSVCLKGKGKIWIATGGGTTARVFHSKDCGKNWEVFNTPLKSGEATGIFSIAFRDEKNGIVVGGNYQEPDNKENNCAITSDGGRTWTLIQDKNPSGYRSCVSYIDKNTLVCTGTNGSDISKDGGKTWEKLGTEGFNVCASAGKNQASSSIKIFAAGSKGACAVLTLK